MIHQASVHQIRTGEISRKDGAIIVTMCIYPRGLRKELRDEYRPELAPDKDLLKRWQKAAQVHGHDEGFDVADYENRFQLSDEAMLLLQNYAERSKFEEIYFVCQCAIGEKCHREILMLLAKRDFGAKIDRVFHDYPTVLKRYPPPVKATQENQAHR